MRGDVMGKTDEEEVVVVVVVMMMVMEMCYYRW